MRLLFALLFSVAAFGQDYAERGTNFLGYPTITTVSNTANAYAVIYDGGYASGSRTKSISLTNLLSLAGGGGSDDQTAAEVVFTPTGGLAADDVQEALAELDTEKAAASHVHSGADITSGTVASARIDTSQATDAEVTAAIAALTLSGISGSVTDAQVPNNITIDLATTATTANAGDSATAFFETGTIEDARLPASMADKTFTGTLTVPNDSIALGTKTTGNYAAGDAEAGAALTGDSATAFFSAGEIEIARLPSELLTATEGDAAYVPVARTLTAGVGLSGGGDLSANRTFTLDPTTWSSGTFTLGNSSQASIAFGFGLSGATDPLFTGGNNSMALNVPLTVTGGIATSSGGLALATGQGVRFNTRGFVTPTGDGVFTLTDIATTGFTSLTLGPDDASPNNGMLDGASGVGTDIAGGNLTTAGGHSTGTGAGGDLDGKTSPSAASTSTSANSYAHRFYHRAQKKTLAESSAITFASISLPSGNYIGVEAICTVFASDGTDREARTYRISFSAVNEAGTIPAITVDATAGTGNPTTGDIAGVFTAVVNGNSVDIKCNASTSLTQTSLNMVWSIISLNSDGVAIITPG
jgi:hypothetical protein